jgi:hypothetical protein
VGVQQDMKELTELFKAVFEPRKRDRKPARHPGCKYRVKTYKACLDRVGVAESIYTGESVENAIRCIEDFGSYGGSGYE